MQSKPIKRTTAAFYRFLFMIQKQLFHHIDIRQLKSSFAISIHFGCVGIERQQQSQCFDAFCANDFHQGRFLGHIVKGIDINTKHNQSFDGSKTALDRCMYQRRKTANNNYCI